MNAKESRFGETEKITEAMLNGEVRNIGSIEEVYPEMFVPEHVNEVSIA